MPTIKGKVTLSGVYIGVNQGCPAFRTTDLNSGLLWTGRPSDFVHIPEGTVVTVSFDKDVQLKAVDAEAQRLRREAAAKRGLAMYEQNKAAIDAENKASKPARKASKPARKRAKARLVRKTTPVAASTTVSE